MGETMSISIPLDGEGYLLLQCPSCGQYFKVRSEDYESDDVEELWCPACGLKNDSFWTEEVLALAKAKAMNKFVGDLQEELSKIGSSSTRRSFLRMSVKTDLAKEREGEILPAVDAYQTVVCGFCGRQEKIKPLSEYVGAFCAFCGERI
jgi:predicted RNA-binding Zn-ribbon protein involved in translation (DUF1610 family)